MYIEEHTWHSPSLNRQMALKVYGHWGDPYIVFPCSRGRYFDYEGLGMIDAIAGYINGGRIKLFCVDSIDAESCTISASHRPNATSATRITTAMSPMRWCPLSTTTATKTMCGP